MKCEENSRVLWKLVVNFTTRNDNLRANVSILMQTFK